MAIDADAGDGVGTAVVDSPSTKPAVIAQLTWAKLYTKAMHKDICSRTQSGGVSVVALETTRTTQLLPEHLRTVKRPGASRAQADAPQTHSGDGLLAAGRPLSLVSILCGTQ